MTQDILSAGERMYILEGVRSNLRNDGRKRLDVDSFSIELDILPYCVCSSQVVLHGTKVIVGLKLEVAAPDTDQPSHGKIQCSVRCSPCSAPWKRNYELEAMNFDLSRSAHHITSHLNIALPVLDRELQNVMGDGNGIDLKELCIVPHRLCWVIFVDVLVVEHQGNMFDAVCLGCNACFKTLRIPSLDLKNKQELTDKKTDHSDHGTAAASSSAPRDSLFEHTEISKKATIQRMRERHKRKRSKHSGHSLPFQDSMALDGINGDAADVSSSARAAESGDMSEVQFEIDSCAAGQRLAGVAQLPIVVTMAIMDGTTFFVADPVHEEELCCDLMLRIAVFADGRVCLIKYGDKAIAPELIFEMLESGKQCGMRWMRHMDDMIQEEEEEGDDAEVMARMDSLKLSTLEMGKEEEAEMEAAMREELEALSFITESLRAKEHDHTGGESKRKDKEEMEPDVEDTKADEEQAAFLGDDSSSNDEEEMIIVD